MSAHVAMDRAVAFVEAHGGSLASARARALAGSGNAREVLALLGEPCAAGAAAAQLTACADLRLLTSDYVGRLCAGLQDEGLLLGRAATVGYSRGVTLTKLLGVRSIHRVSRL